MIIISIENKAVDETSIKNQKDIPAVTANDLNLGDDVFILYRIDKRYKSRLAKSCNSNQCN